MPRRGLRQAPDRLGQRRGGAPRTLPGGGGARRGL